MTTEETNQIESEGKPMRSVIAEVLSEYMELQKSKSEPAYKAELEEERRKRETLERRMNELAEENRRSKERAEEAERTSTIRTELQRLGVVKVDLAYRAVKDDVGRAEDGRFIARDGQSQVDLREYLTKFVHENPELLPARMTGGSGTTLANRSTGTTGSFDLDRIKPGMDPRELEQIRKEIARIALQPGN